MPDSLPQVIRVSVPQPAFDPDAIDTEVHCVNNTLHTFSVSTKSESFTTIDEESGAAVPHGSSPETCSLASGESALIAVVMGWEWDGHVGIELYFQQLGKGAVIVKSYNLKESKGEFTISPSGKKGRVISPVK